MHRASLIELLRAYQADRPAEGAVASRILALVESHADCFERACRPGHITGSAWVTTADRERHLLVHHRKLAKWLQPGGHADGDPDIAGVALREAREESGLSTARLASRDPIDLDVHLIPERRDASGAVIETAHEHHDIRFLCVADADEPIVVSEESHDVRWFDESELRGVTSEWSVLRLLEKAQAAR